MYNEIDLNVLRPSTLAEIANDFAETIPLDVVSDADKKIYRDQLETIMIYLNDSIGPEYYPQFKTAY